MDHKKQEWSHVITPKHQLFDLNLKEVWAYRDLLVLFVKRDIVTVYKQTVLGPLWYLIEPLFTSVVFTLVFNNVANVSTGETPSFLFNMAGIVFWGYFRTCLTSASSSFASNASIFSKVYYPRLIAPLTTLISNIFKLSIQVFIFIIFYVYYMMNGAQMHISIGAVLIPIYIFLLGVLGTGIGLSISALVTKYRDMRILINFGMQLFMYMSAVMYPISFFVEKMPEISWLVQYNPIALMLEFMRNLLFDATKINFINDAYMLVNILVVTLFVLLLGVFVFNRTEKNFIDTI